MSTDRRSLMFRAVATSLLPPSTIVSAPMQRGQPESWWKRAWSDNGTRAPFSGRSINHGCMFVADAQIERYRDRLGCYPDAQGALTIAQRSPTG